MLSFLNNQIFSLLIPLLLLFAGLFLCVKVSFFSVLTPRCIRASLRSSHQGAQSPFRALTMALAGTLGVGNIVGVTSAILLGGAGAVFWMLLSACLAMTVKYGETVLAVRYRDEEKGVFHGGAMHYIKKGMGSSATAVLFCLLCIGASFFIGNLVQTNAVVQAMDYAFSIPPIVTGIAFACLIFLVIVGGVKRIADVTVCLIPLLTVLYLIASFAIVIVNVHRVPSVFGQILDEAFSVRPIFGGLAGYGIKSAMRYGVARGLMSNEAGCGTAPIAHASATTDSPAKQGIWGVFEVLIDTVVLCTVTAFVVLLSCPDQSDPMKAALAAYGAFFGDWLSKGLALAIVCFAFASVVGWSYYATECIGFLSKKKRPKELYLFFYALTCVFSSFFQSEWLLEITDFFVYAMTFLNTLCVLRLSPVIRKETALFVEMTQK